MRASIRKFGWLSLLLLLLLWPGFAAISAAGTLEKPYSVETQVAAGSSITRYVSISGAPSGAVITKVEAKFDYIAFDAVQNYVSCRFNRGSDPGTSGGVSLVSQGGLPEGNPATYGYYAFSNWNNYSPNSSYYFRFVAASGSPYPPTLKKIYVRVTYQVPAPGTPSLISPSDYHVWKNTAPPSFDWGDTSGAVKYRIWVDNYSYFPNPDIYQEPTSSYYNHNSNLPNNIYYWKVQGINSEGVAGSWSSTRRFCLDTGPSAPSLSGPSNGSVFSSSDSATFSWSGPSCSGCTLNRYYLRIVPGTNFNSTPQYETENLSYPTNSKNVGFSGWSSGTYTWSVRAIKDAPDGYSQATYENAGLWGDYASTRTFTIDNPPTFSSGTSLASSANIPEWKSFSGYAQDDIGLGNIKMIVSGPVVSNYQVFSESLSGTSKDLSAFNFQSDNVNYANVSGDYTVQLVITDSRGQTTSKTFYLTVTAPPEGYVDPANCSGIPGWARDPDTTSSIYVLLYADGPSSSGSYIGRYLAADYRADLSFTDKNHGFTLPVPESLLDGASHSFYVYAEDAQDGSLTELSGSPTTLSCYLPKPTNFSAQAIANGIRLTWDPVTSVTSPEYEVFLGLDSGVSDTSNFGSDVTTESTYDHTGLDANVTYYYCVRTRKGSLLSQVTSEKHATAPSSDLTISMTAPPSEAEQGTDLALTCTVSRTGGLLRPVEGFVRVYVYMNQDPGSYTAEDIVLGDTGTPFDITNSLLDDGSETATCAVPIPTGKEGPHYIHVVADGPEHWSESSETNNSDSSALTMVIYKPGTPPLDEPMGVLARTVNDPDVYWIKYGKKWPFKDLATFQGLGYTDAEVTWYSSGALDDLGLAKIILQDDDNFVYRKAEQSTVYLIRNGVSDFFFNWETFTNSQFGAEDVYWATDAGCAWIQSQFPVGQLIGESPRIRIQPTTIKIVQ